MATTKQSNAQAAARDTGRAVYRPLGSPCNRRTTSLAQKVCRNRSALNEGSRYLPSASPLQWPTNEPGGVVARQGTGLATRWSRVRLPAFQLLGNDLSSHTCASLFEQYELLPVKGRRCPVARTDGQTENIMPPVHLQDVPKSVLTEKRYPPHRPRTAAVMRR